jgi:membrane-bound serine protease (ClpP class)
MRAFLPRAGTVACVLLLLLAAPVLIALPGSPPAADAPASVLEINGPIGPATARYVVRGIDTAARSRSQVIILELDTPGGLDSSMRDIIRAILASRIPVVGYVYPPGSRAASAGTYILYACHVAAMAPATEMGAATPVSIMPGGEEPGSSPSPAPTPVPGAPPMAASSSSSSASVHEPSGTMERKVVNDAVAYIRGLAELRGRNADWAEQAVRGAASLPASAALEQHVVDLIAPDLPALLNQLDGREVRVGPRTVKLATRGAGVVRMKPDWRTELLAVITNPTVAYGLMLIGIYGLLLEGYNPGAVLPGVVGTIALLLALFAFQILSVNYAGLALVAVGVGLIIAEFFFPTYGSLGLGGLIAFVVGSLILFDTDVPGMNIGLPLIAGMATAGGLLILAIAYVATRSFTRPVVTGVQSMLGDRVEVVMEAFTGKGVPEGLGPCKGRVRYRGEFWNAQSSAPLRPGQVARIVKVEGLTLWVEPL